MFNTEAEARAAGKAALDELWGGRREGLWELHIEQCIGIPDHSWDTKAMCSEGCNSCTKSWGLQLKSRHGFVLIFGSKGWHCWHGASGVTTDIWPSINVAMQKAICRLSAKLNDLRNDLEAADACFDPHPPVAVPTVEAGARLSVAATRAKWHCYVYGRSFDDRITLLLLNDKVVKGEVKIDIRRAERYETNDPWLVVANESFLVGLTMGIFASYDDAVDFCGKMGWPIPREGT